MEQLIERLQKVITDTDKIPFVWYDRPVTLRLCSWSNQLRVFGDPTVSGMPLWSEYQCHNLMLAIKEFLIISSHDPQTENIYQLIQKFKPIFEYVKEYGIGGYSPSLTLDDDGNVAFTHANKTTREQITKWINRYSIAEITNDFMKLYKKFPKKLKKFRKKQEKQLKADKKATKEITMILKLEPAVVRFCQFCGKIKTECEC